MISPNEILEMVSLQCNIPVEVIKNPNIRLKHVLSARHKAFKMLYDKCYMSAKRIGVYFHMDPTNISQMLKRETQNDNR